MKFIAKMERKFGRYSIKNLPLILVICFGLGYLIYGFFPNVTMKLIFSPADIIVGHEYWRLFTWILTPPGGISLLGLIMLFFYYNFGVAIERGIGTFMFNVYILGSWFWNTLACMIVSLYYYFKIGDPDIFYLFSMTNSGIEMMMFMQYSLFLGFALVYSESVVLLYFVLPFKASWIAYIDMIFLAIEFVQTGNVLTRTSIIAYLINFFILYLIMRSYSKGYRPTAAQMKRRRAYKKQVDSRERSRRNDRPDIRGRQDDQIPAGITRHKCAVCGRSEKDDPNLEFRFCSKCKGNYEYCSDHLFTHEHVK
ncbi:MAG: hypothetical protein ACI39Q_02960 [Wujia sp.]